MSMFNLKSFLCVLLSAAALSGGALSARTAEGAAQFANIVSSPPPRD